VLQRLAVENVAESVTGYFKILFFSAGQ